jgi:hypothetical protein
LPNLDVDPDVDLDVILGLGACRRQDGNHTTRFGEAPGERVVRADIQVQVEVQVQVQVQVEVQVQGQVEAAICEDGRWADEPRRSTPGRGSLRLGEGRAA